MDMEESYRKMREIKFRAWDINGKKMYIPSYVVDEDGQFCTDGDYINECENRNHAHCVQMQYTGIKDRNGKEIYEGDIIVNWWIGPDGQKRSNEGQGVVEMEEGCFGYMCRNSKIWYHLYSRLEVIGNIYENPELLEGK